MTPNGSRYYIPSKNRQKKVGKLCENNDRAGSLDYFDFDQMLFLKSNFVRK